MMEYVVHFRSLTVIAKPFMHIINLHVFSVENTEESEDSNDDTDNESDEGEDIVNDCLATDFPEG